jgi:hypothetical protein
MDARTTRLAEAIHENAELLANINGDLDRMPAFKQGTAWHTDRVRAREDLLRRRDLLRSVVERN